MNEKTLVSVHGYAGDMHQIKNMMKFYEHHQCPVVIFSPEDSKIEKVGPHICKFGGRRAYIGPLSLQRQVIQLQMLLNDFPDFDWFLMNDSDSICLTPEIPKYLYARPDVLWGNLVSDEMHPRRPDYPFPRQALQPPYFCSRATLKKFVDYAPSLRPDPQTPFIDWQMRQVPHIGKFLVSNFKDGCSCPTTDGSSLGWMIQNIVDRGAVMLHSIKTPRALQEIVNARVNWRRAHGLSLIDHEAKG